MQNHSCELPIPQIAEVDSDAREVIRIWRSDTGDHVSMATGLWEDPRMWGILLADFMKSISLAYHQESGNDQSEVREQMKEGFDAEWNSPTDDPRGKLFDP